MAGVVSPYYSPADYGLSIVASVDTDEPYEFDMVVIWRDAEGSLWGGHDSGCSCPTPFEDFHSTADMTAICSLDDVRGLLDGMSTYGAPGPTAIFDFLAKAREALAAA